MSPKGKIIQRLNTDRNHNHHINSQHVTTTTELELLNRIRLMSIVINQTTKYTLQHKPHYPSRRSVRPVAVAAAGAALNAAPGATPRAARPRCCRAVAHRSFVARDTVPPPGWLRSLVLHSPEMFNTIYILFLIVKATVVK